MIMATQHRNGLWWVAAGIGALMIAERLWPRRARTQQEPQRTARNAALGGMSLFVVARLQRPLALPLAQQVADRRQGLAQALPAPAWARDAAAMLLLDWTMYHWHVATHRNALLWRLHLVHHVDLDMDASTALRFHAADMVLSVPLRLAQIRVLGVSPRALAVWEGWFFASVLFHHSNLAMPFDQMLAWLLTTPAMHDIHHRADLAASDSNFSSGLSLWDRLHGTFSEHVPAVPIGVPGYRNPDELGIIAGLAMPFGRQRAVFPPVVAAMPAGD